ncbi:MAG: hypothetical protein ACOYOA_09640, partial [Saprospiraceae bacterium]
MKNFVLTLIFTLLGAVALNAQGTYTGSGSVTQGLGITTTANLLPGCSSNHVTPLGKITSSDKKEWIVPAETNFLAGPYATDLHNACNKFEPTTLSSVNLNSVPVKVVDADGEVITGFIFCDNYFELYVNGVLVGVDPVPFTPFNSCVVKFKVSKPYTIAVKMVDWEENVGLGSEIQSPTVLYHPGDGGFIAQFSDGTVTDASWKTQTFYIAPIQNLSSVVELPDGTRSTANATTNPTCNANCYGIHYEIPSNWNSTGYNDSGWPSASLYNAAQVTNSTAYTNFAASAWPKAKFIWSSNLILDNVVLSRKTVAKSTNTSEVEEKSNIRIGHLDAASIFIIPENDLRQVQI